MSACLSKVMHVVDSLEVGGTETVAVNIANSLPRDRYRVYLCSTRRSGPLAATLQSDVNHLSLNRRGRLDLAAIVRLWKFIAHEDIQLLHVHSTSLFIARLISFAPYAVPVRLIWHDHYGRCELNDRSAGLYRLATAGAAGVIAVNHQLVTWACRELHVPPKRVWYVPNFVQPSESRSASQRDLPGSAGSRIVCVANLRPQKDHFTLIRAMALVRKNHPQAHLLLIGAPVDPDYTARVRQEVTALQLENAVTFLGQVSGVGSILPQCDLGVLSSASEGLPLSLLEYGWAGLPSVATSVGQCPEVLDHGKAGILVNPGSPDQLAASLGSLLESRQRRAEYGRLLGAFVRKTFDPQVIMDQICRIYDLVLSSN